MESGFTRAIDDWAFTDARAAACAEALLFVWRHPEHREEFGKWVDLFIFEDEGLTRLVIERWDRREEILALLAEKVRSPEAIRAVLDGEVESSLASGAL